MIKKLHLIFSLCLISLVNLQGQSTPDFFTLHAGELPEVYYGLKPQPMSLLGVDTTKGIIYCARCRKNPTGT